MWANAQRDGRPAEEEEERGNHRMKIYWPVLFHRAAIRKKEDRRNDRAKM